MSQYDDDTDTDDTDDDDTDEDDTDNDKNCPQGEHFPLSTLLISPFIIFQ